METPVSGNAVLESVERLVAKVANRPPRPGFIHHGRSISVRSVLNDVTDATVRWDLAIASRVSRRVPDGRHLLLHDRVGEDCEIVAVTGDVGPTARSLEPALRRLGVQNTSPSNLKSLALEFANSGRGGLVSLDDGTGRLLAGGILGLALRKQVTDRDDFLLCPIDGSLHRDLFGKTDVATACMLLLYKRLDRLNIVVGLASSEKPHIEVHGERFGGKVGEGIERLRSMFRLACSSTPLGGWAAREELSWALWPAVASTGHSASLEPLIRMIQPGLQYEDRVLLVLPESHVLMKARENLDQIRGSVETMKMNTHTIDSLLMAG